MQISDTDNDTSLDLVFPLHINKGRRKERVIADLRLYDSYTMALIYKSSKKGWKDVKREADETLKFKA